MKLLIFAHKPPPYHGQSFMVGMALKALRTTCSNPSGDSCEPIEIFHVDARLSDALSDVGQAGIGKFFRLLGFCAKAIAWRFRFGVKVFYYIPAPPHRVAIVRDWIALGICRLFFPVTIYHWHASGMGQWYLESAKPWERFITKWTVSRPDLSIILRPGNRADAQAFSSKFTAIVPNGIPDPCPEFDATLKPRRIARATYRARLALGIFDSPNSTEPLGPDPRVFRILFMSLCVREKGLFDLLEAVALLNKSKAGSPLRLELLVAGSFVDESERAEFTKAIQGPDLNNENVSVRYCGFVSGAEKAQLLEKADCFCFPTYYEAESFGLVAVEAMAYGLPLIASNWRGLPELLPENYPWIVSPRNPNELAVHLLAVMNAEWENTLRSFFLKNYSEEQFARNLRSAILKMKNQD